ncbi:hypothetical protein C8J56DRAFT_946633, partial [Mycena floridula]
GKNRLVFLSPHFLPTALSPSNHHHNPSTSPSISIATTVLHQRDLYHIPTENVPISSRVSLVLPKREPCRLIVAYDDREGRPEARTTGKPTKYIQNCHQTRCHPESSTHCPDFTCYALCKNGVPVEGEGEVLLHPCLVGALEFDVSREVEEP